METCQKRRVILRFTIVKVTSLGSGLRFCGYESPSSKSQNSFWLKFLPTWQLTIKIQDSHNCHCEFTACLNRLQMSCNCNVSSSRAWFYMNCVMEFTLDLEKKTDNLIEKCFLRAKQTGNYENVWYWNKYQFLALV